VFVELAAIGHGSQEGDDTVEAEVDFVHLLASDAENCRLANGEVMGDASNRCFADFGEEVTAGGIYEGGSVRLYNEVGAG
jgi:hypothetical protein